MIAWLLRFLRVSATVVLLGFLFTRLDAQLCMQYIMTASLGLVALCYLLEWISYGVDSLKQSLFLRARNIKISFSKLVELRFLGSFFNNLLPSNIGGDVIRAVGLSRYLSNAKDSWASILLSRFMGVLAVFPLVTLSLLLKGDSGINIHPTYPMILFTLFMGFYYLFFMNSKVINLFTRTLETRKNRLSHKIYNLYEADYKHGSVLLLSHSSHLES